LVEFVTVISFPPNPKLAEQRDLFCHFGQIFIFGASTLVLTTSGVGRGSESPKAPNASDMALFGTEG